MQVPRPVNSRLRNLRYGIALVLTGCLSWAVMRLMRLYPVGVDDANILFVYSRHLAAGEGLVYNIGGERVEGFSSMLWMLLTAIGYLFTAAPYPLFLLLNILLVGGALGYTLQFVERRAAGDRRDTLPLSAAGLLFLAWMAGNPSYFLWTVTSLMETGLWSALLLVTTVLILRVIDDGKRRSGALALLLAGLLLTRPDGMAWVLYFIALYALVLRWSGMSWRAGLRELMPVIALAGVTMALLLLFRLIYFGFPFPNTYYVKVTPDRWYNLSFGLAYFKAFVLAHGVAILCIAAAALATLRAAWPVLLGFFTGTPRLQPATMGLFALATAVLTGTLLPILMGGDIFGGFRFYQPIWPLLILLLFYLPMPWRRLQQAPPALVAGLALAALAVFTLSNTVRWPSLSSDRQRIAHLYELSERGMRTGTHLHTLFDQRAAGLPSTGVSAAGGHKIGYAGTVIDTMGLNFLPMAHHSGDKKGVRGHAAFAKEVFWDYTPDLLEPTLCPRTGPPVNRSRDPANWLHRIYRGLFDDADFNAAYRFVALDVPGTTDRVCTYMRVELSDELRRSGYTLVDVEA